MNIHEYQAKAVLRAFGAPVSHGLPAFTPDEAEAAAQGTRRPGLGGEERRSTPAGAARASSRRRRPATRAACGSPARSTRSSSSPRQMLGRDAGHGADRPRRQAGQPALHRGRLRRSTRSSISRCWSTAPTARVAFVALDRGRRQHRGRRAQHAGEDPHLRRRSGDRDHAASRPHRRPRARADRRSRQADARA